MRNAVRAEPGAAVEAAFTPLHELMAAGAEPSLDPVIASLSEIQDRLVNLAGTTANSTEATEAVNAKVAALRAEAARLPEPASRLVLAAVGDIEADLRGTRFAQAAQSFNANVTSSCEAIVNNRYPFFRSDRDVSVDEFAALFKPTGLFETYRKEHLDAYIDKTGPVWKWTPDVRLSDRALIEFQRAAEITDAFFDEGEEKPNVDFVVTSRSLDPNALSGVFRINRNFVYASGVVRSTPVKWPGDNSDNLVAVSVTFGANAQTERIERTGPWALFRIMEAGRAVAQDGRLLVDFEVANRRLSFSIVSDGGPNPLTLPALSAFRCPTGL